MLRVSLILSERREGGGVFGVLMRRGWPVRRAPGWVFGIRDDGYRPLTLQARFVYCIGLLRCVCSAVCVSFHHTACDYSRDGEGRRGQLREWSYGRGF